MGSPLGLGAVVVTGLATAGLAFLIVPGLGAARPAAAPASAPFAGAEQAAQEFWDLALDGECRAASDLMWWPADRAARQRGYERICRTAEVPDAVAVGEPRTVGSTQTPYGATDYVLVPVTLRTDGVDTVDDLAMVQVDGDWFVIR